MKDRRGGTRQSKQWIGVGLFTGAGLAASLCAMAPAFAERYGTPGNVVSVGTNGSDTNDPWPPIVGISQGGCAGGGVAIAVGESNRSCDGYGMDASAALLAVALLDGDAHSVVAVASTGNAKAMCITPIPWGYGCAEPGVAVSGTGTASGDGHTVSGTGPSQSNWRNSGNHFWPSVSAAGTNNASGGNVAVSGTGRADAYNTTAYNIVPNTPVTYGGVAVAGGDADAHGGLIAVSATGDACNATVYSLAPRGRAC